MSDGFVCRKCGSNKHTLYWSCFLCDVCIILDVIERIKNMEEVQKILFNCFLEELQKCVKDYVK